MFNKILVPLDGSSTSEVALDYLSHLRVQEILLGRVYPEFSDAKEIWVPLPPEAEPEVQRDCLRYLEDVRSRLDSTLNVQVAAIPGEPAEAILRLAESAGCDLILMTSHGRRGLRRFLLGSVAEKLTRYATCPVMMVGRNVTIPAVVPVE